ncbi:MAG TPA: DUF916 domain-containing protein [Candidatus Saccharimonadales bacterium]|nr:DUF916 domain-containing protein [Candidatus Saccharimonadales bacterium]
MNQRIKKHLLFTTLAVCLLAVVGLPLKSIAATDNTDKTSLAVSPPTFDLSANPGDTLHDSIKVQNITDKTVDINTSIKNFVAVGTEGEVGLTDQNGQYSLAKWIHVTPSSAVLQAKESKVFNFTVDVPKNAEPGGKFGSIVFSTTHGASGASAVGVSQQIGTLLLLRIAGDAKEQASISSMLADHTSQNDTVTYKTLISNEGNVQVKPIGSITITNMFGKKVATIPFGGKYVIPGAKREFINQWQHSGMLIGKYTATLTLLYGTKNMTLTSSVSFISIPWKMLGIILFIAVIIGLMLWKARNRLKRAFRILFEKE